MMRQIGLMRALVIASLGLVTSQAVAADLAQPAAPWRTGVISGSSGQFSYCVSEAPFSSGLWLLMALNADGEINLGLGQRGGTLTVGTEKTATVSVDGRQSWLLKTKVTKPELTVMNGGKNEALMKALATGSTLTIDGQSFALKASGAAISTLRACVASKGQPSGAPTGTGAPSQATPSAPPPGQVIFDDSRPARAPQPPTPTQAPLAAPQPAQPQQVLAAPSAPLPSDLRTAAPVPTAQNAQTPLAPAKALPPALTALLNKAGAAGLQPAPLPAGSAYAWQTGTGLKGSVREQVVPPGTDLAQVVRSQLAAEASICLGKFRSDASDKRATATTEVQTLTLVCGPTVTGFVFAMGTSVNSTGAVLSVIRHEGPENGRVTALTTALARSLGN